MDMIIIVASLIVLLVLTLKKVPITIAALITVILIAAFSGVPIVQTITEDYVTGFADFVKSAWLMLLLGGILSKLMDISGGARSISQLIIEKLGEKRAIPAIIIAGGLLTYGGVQAMVACFALYPIVLAVFREANLPRALIPGVIGAGIFTWVNMLPGSPAIINIIPTTFLDTTAMAAPMVGIIAAGTTLVLTMIYFDFEVKKSRKKGLGFTADSETNKVLEQADELESKGVLPNSLASLLPLISITVVLNVFKTDISVALLVGILMCVVVFFKNLRDIPNLKDSIANAATGAATVTITASAIVGIGSVISITPGFTTIVDSVLNFSQSGGNPLIIFAIATTLLCGLNASGMGGLSITLNVLAEPFIAMGVNPEILHRIGSIASTGLDSLPHSGGVVAVLAISGISYKEGYKHLFVTTVLITLIALAVALILGNMLYPV
ncbi:GntP family permease [Amphibacillus sp. Q70]|uniref:GntP family permease n=1 Tax=Amphibacillus sp. Q70 TaxID=3453416 RepID=UPI003F85B049